MMRSPSRSTSAAGEPAVIRSMRSVGLASRGSPIENQYRPMRITNASTMLTAGPAAITTSRFHTGWR